ncbi:MAG: hypothetical protein IPH91_10700 [Elusimicrobia bacterium]|nr:hypothetical protein [Elusimicrobiota bacterium]
MGYVRLADRISVERLLGDLTEWEDRVVRRWALSLGEKQWAAETRRLRLASKLVDFALTPSGGGRGGRTPSARPLCALWRILRSGRRAGRDNGRPGPGLGRGVPAGNRW